MFTAHSRIQWIKISNKNILINFKHFSPEKYFIDIIFDIETLIFRLGYWIFYANVIYYSIIATYWCVFRKNNSVNLFTIFYYIIWSGSMKWKYRYSVKCKESAGIRAACYFRLLRHESRKRVLPLLSFAHKISTISTPGFAMRPVPYL